MGSLVVCDTGMGRVQQGVRRAQLPATMVVWVRRWNPLANINDPTPSSSSPEEGLVNGALCTGHAA